MDSKEVLEYFLEFSRFNNACVLSCDECPNKLCNIKRAYEEIRNDLNMLEGLKKDYLELSHEWQKDLKVLEILKYRIHLKDSILDQTEVSFVEATGFVFKNSEEYKMLKEFLKK